MIKELSCLLWGDQRSFHWLYMTLQQWLLFYTKLSELMRGVLSTAMTNVWSRYVVLWYGGVGVGVGLYGVCLYMSNVYASHAKMVIFCNWLATSDSYRFPVI